MQLYRAVGNRCAVDLNALNLPIPEEEALAILNEEGFQIIEVFLAQLAHQCLGKPYRRGAKLCEAPYVFDCSSLIKWLYGQKGIELPRRSVQQYKYLCAHGQRVSLQELIEGDLVFTLGRWNWVFDDINDALGHVGIATDRATIVHATNTRRRNSVVEESLEDFLVLSSNSRGSYRLISPKATVYTFITPPDREVQTSDDIHCIILERLGKIRRL